MGKITDKIKEAKVTRAWTKKPLRAKELVRDNPCLKCGYCTPKLEHDEVLLIDICFNPERVKDTGRDWTVTNQKGEKCEYYQKERQLRFGVDI